MQKQRKKYLRRQQLLHNSSNLQSIDFNFTGEEGHLTNISKYQFVLSVLIHLGTLKVQEDILPWCNRFEELHDTFTTPEDQITLLESQDLSVEVTPQLLESKIIA